MTDPVLDRLTSTVASTIAAGVLNFTAAASVTATALDQPAATPAAERAAATAETIEAALARADEAVAAIVAIPDAQRTFDNTIGAIDDMFTRLQMDTSMIQFMAYVHPEAAIRDAGTTAEERVTNYLIDLSKREDLYRAVKAYADTNPKLEGEQKRLLEFTLRDYKRSGMMLAPEQREQLKQIEMQLNKLGIEFEKNIRDDESVLPLTAEELAGVPEDVLAGLPRSEGLYIVGMDYPIFDPILAHCDHGTTRQKVWTIYKRQGGKKNVGVLEQILALRAHASELLGYESPAAFETEVYMSKNPAAVAKFYEDLRPLVRRKAEKDYEEFVAAKREDAGDPNAVLYPWDATYYENRLRESKYAVDSEKVREYFPLDAVLDGYFGITQSLFGVEYREVGGAESSWPAAAEWAPWHPDVMHYEVYDKVTQKQLGEFYLDLFPRDNKYGHAAQWGLVPRKTWNDGKVTLPVAALVCNFTKPTADKPSLMAHDEVVTFFHEFGHCLHTILSEARYGRFAGTSTSTDFVEAPSQMLENWAWDKDVLKTFARHYETGETIPDAMVDGMLAARNLGSGMFAEHQIFYGMVDQAFHTAPKGKVDTTAVQEQLFGEIELYPPIPETWYHASFGHFTGYQASYYGYLWSLVFAQDMFERFRERGVLSPEAGQYYRKKILARGGSVDEMEMLKDYLGREPKMDAFLRHLGLTP